MRAWEAGEIPRAVSLPGTGGAVRAYPALVDEGASVGVAVLDTPEAQRASMRAGTRRLLRLTVPSPMRRLADRLGTSARLALSTAPHESADALLDDVLDAALDALVARAGGPARDAAGFARLRGQVAGGLELAAGEALDHVIAILDLAREVRERLDALTSVALQPARADVAAQLRRLVRPGFATATGVERLPDVERYLRAALRRLDRLPNAPAPDRERMSAVHELERAYRRALEAWPRGRPVPEPLRELPWMLEELRVSQFAQALGTRGPASSTRIRRVLDEVASP
jgi:ATP-dependent helicase HrpA